RYVSHAAAAVLMADVPDRVANVALGVNASDEELVVQMTLYDLRVDPLERVNVAYHEPYEELAAFFRKKLATIILGDGRVEAAWNERNEYHFSNFAPGAHDRILDFPEGVVPEPQLPSEYEQLAHP
ncbi:MAG: hypothetical protein AAF561_15510, partial [Planctomycetota bacterium]